MNLSHIFTGIKELGFSLALGAGVVGCAVLTVDVDVYKGALVNEEHVQLHQLLALATAAKPMLVQLRDSIEWPSEEMPVKTDRDDKKWYKSGYVDPLMPTVPPKASWLCKRITFWPCSETNGEYEFFRNRLAVRVNEVLGLYEELDAQGKKRTRESISPGEESGLTLLAENYLVKSREVDHNNLGIDQKEQEKQNEQKKKALGHYEERLINALVEFSQKVLFLANHEGLASRPNTPGLILGGAEKLQRGLLGDFLTDHSMYVLLDTELADVKKQQYVRVLQAVGNSILFSANELRERERYREQGQRKVKDEVTAANSVYSPEPKKVLDDLLEELEHETQAAQKALDDAKVRKRGIEARIGSPTTGSPTGLHAEKDKAQKDETLANETLNSYRNSLDTLKAIHDVLTDDLIQQIKSQWNVGQPDPTDVTGFLKSTDGFSLKDKLDVARQSQNGTPTPQETLRWTNALQYVDSPKTGEHFEAYRMLKGQTSLKRSELFAAFVTHINELDTRRVKQIAQYESTYGEKKAALDRIEQEIDTLGEEVTRLGERILKLPGEIADFDTSKTEIESVKSDVLEEADRSRQFVSPGATYLLISSRLGKKTTPASKMAQKILSSRTPPPGMHPLDSKDYKSPTEVMDAVIALLRHHQMDEVQRYGKDSSESKLATEAVENAYQHRAGMVYIRPSSAYLRTSFPSTSLQEDPNLAWDNMLLKQGIRNLPFSSEVRDILNPSEKQDRAITSELDKQYWQNINRVRVSGAGFTNQALVKDDVGNWYVKQYYGNTEKIWQSAKNLALFSLSTKVPIDLAKQLHKASSSEEYSENSKESPTLQKVLEKHQGAYKTHTDEVQAKLERLHAKDGTSELHASIVSAWDTIDGIKNESSFRTSLHEALKSEMQEWNKAAAVLKEKSDQDQGQAIVKDVRALSRLERMLSARIKEIQPPDSIKDKSVQTKAVSAVHRIVGGLVLDILADRNQALERYEQAIMFIGDAANPKEAKQSNSNSGTPKYEDIRK